MTIYLCELNFPSILLCEWELWLGLYSCTVYTYVHEYAIFLTKNIVICCVIILVIIVSQCSIWQLRRLTSQDPMTTIKRHMSSNTKKASRDIIILCHLSLTLMVQYLQHDQPQYSLRWKWYTNVPSNMTHGKSYQLKHQHIYQHMHMVTCDQWWLV